MTGPIAMRQASTSHLERIVVVGASLAGLAAARTLRAEGYSGELTIVGDEPHRPYDRPPLSKKFLTSLDPHTDLGSDDVPDATWVLGVAATDLDPIHRTVGLSDGRRLSYDGVVIATGAAPRVLPGFDRSGVHTVRGISDATLLREALSSESPRVALVGAGFIGAEVASTCIELGIPVTMVDHSAVPFSRALGTAVGAELAALYRRQGVDLRSGRTVTAVLGGERVSGIELDDGSVIDADVVVLSAGVIPATGWLGSSGLPLDDGLLCDPSLRVGPNIVAAGDVARWPNRRLGEFRRVEHWENAITSGEHAARTLLAGTDAVAPAYEPVPWVWSDQFGFKLQFVGSSIDHDEVFLDSALESEGRLLALYRKGDRLLGACGIRRNKAVLSLRESVGLPGSWAAALEVIGVAPHPA